MSSSALVAQPAPSMLAVTRLACEVSVLQEDLKSSRSSNEKLQQELAESREARQKAEKRSTELTERARGLQQAHEMVTQQLQSKVGAAEAEASRLQTELRQREAEAQELLSRRSSRLEGLQVANQELQQRLEAAQGEIGKLARQLGAQGCLVDAVEAELAATRAAVGAVTEQSGAHAAAITAYQRRLRETVASKESLLGEIERGQARVKEAQEKLRERIAQAAEQAGQLEEARQDAHSRAAAVSELESRLAHAHQSIATLTAEQADVMRHLAWSTELLQQSRAAGVQQREALQQLHRQLAAMQAEAAPPPPPPVPSAPPAAPPGPPPLESPPAAKAITIAQPGEQTAHVLSDGAGHPQQQEQHPRGSCGGERSNKLDNDSPLGESEQRPQPQPQPQPQQQPQPQPQPQRGATPSDHQYEPSSSPSGTSAPPIGACPQAAGEPQSVVQGSGASQLTHQNGQPAGSVPAPALPRAFRFVSDSVADLEIEDDPMSTFCGGGGVRPAAPGGAQHTAAESTKLACEPSPYQSLPRLAQDPACREAHVSSGDDFSFVSAAPVARASAGASKALMLPPAPVLMCTRVSQRHQGQLSTNCITVNRPSSAEKGNAPPGITAAAQKEGMYLAFSSGANQKDKALDPVIGKQFNESQKQRGTDGGAVTCGAASTGGVASGTPGGGITADTVQVSGPAAKAAQFSETAGAPSKGDPSTSIPAISSSGSGGKTTGMADMFASFSFMQAPAALAGSRTQQAAAGVKRKAPEGDAARNSGGGPAKK